MKLFRRLFVFITTGIFMFSGAVMAATITISPGNESGIATAMNNGDNVELQSGQTYTLSSSEQIYLSTSNVVLNGNGATILLDTSFDNFLYNTSSIHGDLENNSPSPLADAFAIYIATGSNNITIKNVKFDRIAVPGSVIRTIAVIKSSNVTLDTLEITGDTIGPVIEFFNCDTFKIVNSKISNILADDSNNSLITISGTKPNLTGILVDDVDLLPTKRKDFSYHSSNFLIFNNRIENLSMSSNIEAVPQTDAINIQRGKDFFIFANVLINVNEGIDTFAFKGHLKDNVIKATTLTNSDSAGVKIIHGASHNLIEGNLIINRNKSTLLAGGSSTLGGSNGTYGNVIVKNKSAGTGSKIYKIEASGDILPRSNFMLRNSGGSYSINYFDNGSNVFFTTEPSHYLLGDFTMKGVVDDPAVFFSSNGTTNVYYRTASAGFDGYNFNRIQNSVCKIAACDDDITSSSHPLYCPPNNLKANCTTNHTGMDLVFSGRFLANNNFNKQDFLFLDVSGSTIADRFQRNDGNMVYSQFSYELPGYPISSIYENFLVADFDGNGLTDVLLHSENDGVTKFFRNDDVTSTSQIDFTTFSNPITPSAIDNESTSPIVAVKSGDFNGDGKDDVFFLWGNGKNRIYQGNNGFSFATNYEMTNVYGDINNIPSEEELEIFDYNQDGFDDILFKLSNDTWRLYTCSGCSTSSVSFSKQTLSF